MRLCSQLAQRHFGALHGFALCAEGGITQTWATVFAEITAWRAVCKTVTASAGAAVSTRARTALTGTCVASTITASWRLSALLTGSVVATHRNHGFGGLGDSGWRWGLGLRLLGICIC
jgi:hypothetical protein